MVDDNTTVPDDNTTSCPPPLQSQFMGGCDCPPDTYSVPVTVHGNSYITCLPNSDCDVGQIYQNGVGCTCPSGFYPDQNMSCQKYVASPDDNTTPPDDNSTDPDHPGQIWCTDHWQLNSIPCSSDPDGGNTNDNNNSNPNPNDPCSYPLFSNGMGYQNATSDEDTCIENSQLFGDGSMAFDKNPDCFYGGCYYNNKRTSDSNSTPPPPSSGNNGGTISTDANGTQHLDLNLSNLTGAVDKINANVADANKKLETINNSINNQSNRLNSSLAQLNGSANGIKGQVASSGNQISNTLNALNDSIGTKITQSSNSISGSISAMQGGLGGKLDDIKGAITGLAGDGNGTKFVPTESNVSHFTVSDERMREFNSKISSVREQLSDAGALIDTVKSEFSTFASNIQTSYTGLVDGLASYQDMFENKPTVAMPSSGSCNLKATVLGKQLDLGASLCSSMHIVSPYLVFILTIGTQLSLIFTAMYLFRKD